MGFWDPSDDMSADMYVPFVENYAIFLPGQRLNIKFESRYCPRWMKSRLLQQRQWSLFRSSRCIPGGKIVNLSSIANLGRTTYESRLGLPSESNPSNTVETERKIRKGFWGKKKGIVSVSIEVRDSYIINVGHSQATSLNSFSMPIKMRYSPISADLPPSVSSLSARLYAHTTYNVDSHKDPRNSGKYNTSVTILRDVDSIHIYAIMA